MAMPGESITPLTRWLNFRANFFAAFDSIFLLWPIAVLAPLLIACAAPGTSGNAGSPADRNSSGISATLFDPDKTVGRLDFSTDKGGSHCSAVLVGPDMILTAGHCCVDENEHTFYWNF
jgi:hypothetical protein